MTTAQDAEFLETIDRTSSLVDLHKSNIFRLKTDELVKEVALDFDCQNHEYILSIRHILEEIKLQNITGNKYPLLSDQGDIHIHSSNTLQAQVLSPIGLTKPSGNANVLPTIDILVRIPNDVFSPKDYLRNRYFDKRNAIVSHVGKLLTKKKQPNMIGKVFWRYYQADKRKPILLLIPPEKAKIRVRLLFTTESMDWIPPLRLVPNRNNLSQGSSSIFYNHALVEDLFFELPDQDNYPRWNESVILVKVWCLQRGLLRNHDGLDTTQIAVLMLYLYRTKKANPRMEPQQVFSVFWKFIAETDWLGEGKNIISGFLDGNNLIRGTTGEGYQEETHYPRTIYVLPHQERNELQTIAEADLSQLYAKQTRESPLSADDPPTLVELYRQMASGPVLLDPTLTHNYLGRCSPSYMRTLQRHAAHALECIVGGTKPYAALFLQEVRFWSAYDAYLKIPFDDLKLDVGSSDLDTVETTSRRIIELLRRALGNRVQDVSILSTGNGQVGCVHPTDDSDEIPTFPLGQIEENHMISSTGCPFVIVGLNLNTEHCARLVDRGPPADDHVATKRFLDLWGNKAELRRFKDGAIVHAVVWEEDAETEEDYVRFSNENRTQGGIVECIARHILRLHFLKNKKSPGQSSLRALISTVDTVVQKAASPEYKLFDPIVAHRMVVKAFDSLSDFLRKHSLPSIPTKDSSDKKSRLGIPLSIDSVEPLSPSLRYADLFPPIPHPAFGGSMIPGIKATSGAIQSDPVLIQIRFGPSSKWPTDIKAMGAAKTAMLIQLVNGIEEMKRTRYEDVHLFVGPMIVTPAYADIGYRGYLFRIYIRSDPEIKLLQGLFNPSDEAIHLLDVLHQRHAVSSTHHSMMHSVYNLHPSSSLVVRMAKRWASCHLLTDHIPFEAIELMVAKVYTDRRAAAFAPGTVVAGFMRFLHLLSKHDWLKEPLIVDPQNHLTDNDETEIVSQFEMLRGEDYHRGPPMFIISPCDRQSLEDDEGTMRKATDKRQVWSPSFTNKNPELVVLSRAVTLAERSYSFLLKALSIFQMDAWPAIFHESSSSFRSYSAIFRIDPSLVVDTECSSTEASILPTRSKEGIITTTYSRSMHYRLLGPKELRRKLYRNLMDQDEDVLVEWRPIQEAVEALRERLGSFAVFFYNDLCPEVIAAVWRPIFSPRSFSAIVSEYVRPVTDDNWRSDTMVTVNVNDLLREVTQVTQDIVVDQKVFDNGYKLAESPKKRKQPISETQTTTKRNRSDSSERESSEED